MSNFDKFLIDATTMDENRLEQLIAPYLYGIDKGTGQPYFKSEFNLLSSREKVLLLLLTLKVSKLLGKRKTDSSSWDEISSLLHMPGGTVRPILSMLRSEALVGQNEDLSYYIPNHALSHLSFEERKAVTADETDTGQRNEVSVGLAEQRSNKRKVYKKRTIRFEIPRTVWEPYVMSLSRKGYYLERSLLVLKLAKDAGFDGLTPAEIESFMRDSVRSPISKSNISYFLGKSPSSLTDRIPDGKGFRYRIMRTGEERVADYVKSQNVE